MERAVLRPAGVVNVEVTVGLLQKHIGNWRLLQWQVSNWLLRRNDVNGGVMSMT